MPTGELELKDDSSELVRRTKAMTTPTRVDVWRPFPNVITKGDHRNVRWRVSFAADTAGDHEPYAVELAGSLDVDGELTTLGRIRLTRMVAEKARRSKARFCVVWSADACTWFDEEGIGREGGKPPVGEPIDSLDYRHVPAIVDDLWHIELPEGSATPYLCVRTLARDYVELAPGEPMVLGHLDDPVPEGEVDPAEGMLDDDGNLVAPEIFRGQRVTGVRDEWTLLGPVQPSGPGTVLRAPWPEDVHAACESIAGRTLPRSLTDAAWRVVDPEDTTMNWTGVLRAA